MYPQIEDLEITNRSLLVINSSLEATKHRQAKEIRDLRRKLRESRLILPPRAYRVVKSSLESDDMGDDEDEDEDEDDESTEESFAKQDEMYCRVKGLIDALLGSGRKALATTPDDLREGGKGGTKVLSAEEVRTWRDGDVESEDEPGRPGRPLTPLRVAVPGGDNDELQSEDEVEAIVLEPDVAPVPPITVTLS